MDGTGGFHVDAHPVPVDVIIPARNEANSISACLASLLSQDYEDHLRILVVLNGCTDDTRREVVAWTSAACDRGYELVVVETELCGKAAAMNVGDALCRDGIRMYLDADVVLSSNAIRSVAQTLRGERDVHLCSPALRFARPRGVIARSYARVWSSVPYVTNHVMGCGFYAVSPEGRRRWSTFPEILSDDKYVRLHFGTHESRVVTAASFTAFLPDDLGELLRSRYRWSCGNVQLRRLHPDLRGNDAPRVRTTLPFLARRPRLWADTVLAGGLYAAVQLAVGVTALRRRTWSGEWDHRVATAPRRSFAAAGGDVRHRHIA